VSFVELALFLLLGYVFYKIIGKKLAQGIHTFVKEFFNEKQ